MPGAASGARMAALRLSASMLKGTAFSKIFGLASLRVGWGHGSKKIIDALNIIKAPFNVSHLAQLAAIESLKDKNFIDGDYLLHDVKPKNGLKTARMLGHITYSSEAIMDEKFGRNFQDITSKIDRDVDYQVENYLQYKGEKFSDIFDANSYILMTWFGVTTNLVLIVLQS